MKLSTVKRGHMDRFVFFNFVALSMFVSVADEALANASGYPVNKSDSQKESSDRSFALEEPCDTPKKAEEEKI